MADDQEALELLATQHLSEARAILEKRAPYVSSTVYGLIPYFVWGMYELVGSPIAVSRGMVMIVDPKWAASITPEVLAACVLHECHHIIRGLDRLDALPDRSVANIAGDLPINQDLREGGWTLPDWVYYPDSYDPPLPTGLTLEAYYELLTKKPPEQQHPKPKEGSEEGSSNEKGGGQSSKQKKDEKKQDSSQGPGEGQDDDGNRPKMGSGRCGGCSSNPVLESLEDEVDKEVGRGPADRERIRSNTLKDIEDALKGPGKGDVPSSFHEFINIDDGKPVVPWQRVLRRAIRRAKGRVVSGQMDFSLARPSKRSFIWGIPRPGMVNRKPNFCFIEDTSGSMGDEQIISSRVETVSIFKQLGVDSAWHIQADAGVSAPPKMIRMRDIAGMHTYGRGGTSFKPALAAAEKLRPKPDIIVYLTDGDGDAPARAPRGIEVVWCVVPSPYGRRPANWGTVVVVSDDQALRAPYQSFIGEDE